MLMIWLPFVPFGLAFASCATISVSNAGFWFDIKARQEAQLMLTNPRDAFRGQSRPPNIVPFHMLGIVSSCAIVTLSLKLLLLSTSEMS